MWFIKENTMFKYCSNCQCNTHTDEDLCIDCSNDKSLVLSKPVRKWPKWYRDNLCLYMEDLSQEQRNVARKVIKLLDEAVANGVIHDKHYNHGTKLPEGYVYEFDKLLNEAIDLYETIGIK